MAARHSLQLLRTRQTHDTVMQLRAQETQNLAVPTEKLVYRDIDFYLGRIDMWAWHLSGKQSYLADAYRLLKPFAGDYGLMDHYDRGYELKFSFPEICDAAGLCTYDLPWIGSLQDWHPALLEAVLISDGIAVERIPFAIPYLANKYGYAQKQARKMCRGQHSPPIAIVAASYSSEGHPNWDVIAEDLIAGTYYLEHECWRLGNLQHVQTMLWVALHLKEDARRAYWSRLEKIVRRMVSWAPKVAEGERRWIERVASLYALGPDNFPYPPHAVFTLK